MSARRFMAENSKMRDAAKIYFNIPLSNVALFPNVFFHESKNLLKCKMFKKFKKKIVSCQHKKARDFFVHELFEQLN